MASFKIEGGLRLEGELIPQGAKNEALQVLCAVLLTPEPVVIRNVPDIVDVNKMIDLLRAMGVEVEKLGDGDWREAPAHGERDRPGGVGLRRRPDRLRG